MKHEVLNLLILVSDQLDIIFFQPVINLNHIRQHLRTGHQLSVPWFPIVGGTVQEVVNFFCIKKLPDGGLGICKDFF